jgi:hypothetical protein
VAAALAWPSLALAVDSPDARGAHDFDFSAYKAATLAEVHARHLVDPADDYTVEAGNQKYKVVARYTGNHRAISAASLELIRKWSLGLHEGAETAELFAHEIEVTADGVHYWLPIQNPLVEAFDAEVLPDRKVTLYIMYVGARQSEKVFVVNEFLAHPG